MYGVLESFVGMLKKAPKGSEANRMIEVFHRAKVSIVYDGAHNELKFMSYNEKEPLTKSEITWLDGYVSALGIKAIFSGWMNKDEWVSKTMMKLNDTVDLMNSDDYKERFVAEYWQTKIRYERLKVFSIEREVEKMLGEECALKISPLPVLRRQVAAMGEYLHMLELRAVIEGIDLGDE